MSYVPENYERNVIMTKRNHQKTLPQLKLSEWMKWEAIQSLIFFPS